MALFLYISDFFNIFRWLDFHIFSAFNLWCFDENLALHSWKGKDILKQPLQVFLNVKLLYYSQTWQFLKYCNMESKNVLMNFYFIFLPFYITV